MSKSTKGKTWEEIYGKEYAEVKRQQARDAVKKRPSKKGMKWEDIYTPEEVIRRRNRMKNDNPIHKMSEITSENRKKNISENKKEFFKNNPNPLKGYKHSEETKKKISNGKRESFKNECNLVVLREAIRKRTIKYFEKNKILFTCLECKKQKEVLPMFLGKKGRRKFCSTDCQYEYYRKHPHINYKPNTWEKRVIDLKIQNLKFTGDFKFWITINLKGKVYHKNPDFIVDKYSQTHSVLEILGKRFHSLSENEELAKAYKEKNINFLFLTNKDFKLSDLELKNKIKGWIDNVKQN